MDKRVSLYVAVTALAATAAVSWLYMVAPEVESQHLIAAVSFSALGVLAHALKHQLPTGALGSIAFIPFLATVLLAPSWVAAVATGAAVLVVEVVSKKSPLKVVFNVSQHALAVAVAAGLYAALGGTSLLSDQQFSTVALAAMFVSFMAVNSLAVSGVVALSEGRRLSHVWRQNTLSTILYDLFSLPVVYAFAWVYATFGLGGSLVLAVPLLGVRQLYKTNWQLEKVNQDLLQLMVAAIEARDPYTSGHSRRVSRYAKVIARAMGLNSRRIERIGIAALLHDVGKIHEIYAPILRKPDRLTVEEQEIIQTHPIKSAELVENVSHLRDVVAPIRHHHENWDGTGYPDGLAGEEIPLGARIIMVADTIDAMTTDRPYRNGMSPDDVRRELIRLRGVQFDPRVCDALLQSSLFYQIFAPVPAASTPRYVSLIPAQRAVRTGT